MVEFDLEVQINEPLIEFVKNFKNIFVANMIFAKQSSISLSKLSIHAFKFGWTIDY